MRSKCDAGYSECCSALTIPQQARVTHQAFIGAIEAVQLTPSNT